jgi:hypothetical protein
MGRTANGYLFLPRQTVNYAQWRKQMIINIGDKVHVAYRALYENSTRRHFIGEVTASEKSLCRLVGYAFVFDAKQGTFVRKPEKRTTIADLGESGYIANVIDDGVELDAVAYRYERGIGLVVGDSKTFTLDINEFGAKV